MTPLQERAAELRQRVEQILGQFNSVESARPGASHTDLSCRELRVVQFLGDTGPRMMRELADHLPAAVNSMTTMVDNLEKKGIMQRHRSATDRRVVRVTLTDTGRTVYHAAVEEKLRLMRNMLAMLTEDEQEIFMVLFRKIARASQEQCGLSEQAA